MQVWYGYQISGENFPPFGCRQAVNITAALDLKSASFTLITHIRTDYVQGVG